MTPLKNIQVAFVGPSNQDKHALLSMARQVFGSNSSEVLILDTHEPAVHELCQSYPDLLKIPLSVPDFFEFTSLKLHFASIAHTIHAERGGRVTGTDGESGSGKGALMSKLASRMGGRHIDCGLIYRSIAHECGNLRGLSPQSASLEHVLRDLTANFEHIRFDENELRSPAVDKIVADWSELPAVRNAVFMITMREVYSTGCPWSFAEGRVTTTVLFRDSPDKFYVRCPLEIRAERRALQRGSTPEYHYEALKERDRKDMTREYEPLYFDRAGGVVEIINDKTLVESVDVMHSHVCRISRAAA